MQFYPNVQIKSFQNHQRTILVTFEDAKSLGIPVGTDGSGDVVIAKNCSVSGSGQSVQLKAGDILATVAGSDGYLINLQGLLLLEVAAVITELEGPLTIKIEQRSRVQLIKKWIEAMVKNKRLQTEYDKLLKAYADLQKEHAAC